MVSSVDVFAVWSQVWMYSTYGLKFDNDIRLLECEQFYSTYDLIFFRTLIISRVDHYIQGTVSYVENLIDFYCGPVYAA